MSLEPAPKKRKKKVDRCPNPLFVKWLTEWRDEAAEQGKKTQYAYGKALSSLKKYPMPLTSGKEATILDNFGEKICKMLDHKLEKHVEENGESSSLEADHEPLVSSLTTQAHSTSSVPYEDILAVPPPQDEINGVDQQRKRRPSNRGPREYVPVYRSGPYALVLTLYRHYRIPASKRFMLKTELQREAQPLSEKSFRIPDPGSHYTAWSSMSTLISKGFVFKDGNPARYRITEAGRELANKLETVEAQFGQQACGTSPPIGGAPPPANISAVPAGQSKKRKEPGRSNKNLQKAAPAHTVTSIDTHGDTPQTAQNDELTYWYIDDRGKQVISKDDAEVTVDDEISIGFLIKANEAALINSGIRYKRDYSKPSEGSMVYAYLHNDDAVDYCPIPRLSSLPASRTSNLPMTRAPASSISALASSNVTAPSKSKPKKKPSVVDTRTESRFTALSSIPTLNKTSAGKSDSQNSHASSSLYPSSVSDRDNSGPGWSQNSQPQDTDSQASSTSSVSNRMGGFPGTSSHHDGHTERTVNTDEAPTSLYVLKPGRFDIVLCVDSCETSGGQVKTRKQLLLPELQRNGVTLDVRKLQVGDFLWIAREKRVPVPGMIQMPSSRELVLDYVVERKRMDDLCGSILDGRFKEQKFRLKQCGLRKPIYLIEDFGSIDHLSIPASTLRQATVNTQVVDGFFVKHTRDNKESVAYLTVMTRYLQGYYSNKTLEAYRLDDMEKLPSNPSLTNTTQKLMTFKEFNQSSVKNKNTTITETFAKQLLQFSGLTAEKALAITQRYKTPSDLVDAYRACAMEKDKEKLLAHMKFGKLQRNIGPVLSRMLHMFYCSRGPLS